TLDTALNVTLWGPLSSAIFRTAFAIFSSVILRRRWWRVSVGSVGSMWLIKLFLLDAVHVISNGSLGNKRRYTMEGYRLFLEVTRLRVLRLDTCTGVRCASFWIVHRHADCGKHD